MSKEIEEKVTNRKNSKIIEIDLIFLFKRNNIRTLHDIC